MRAFAIVIALAAASAAHAQDVVPAEQAHTELRALKQQLVDAVNKKDEAALLALLHPDVAFTAMNNEFFVGREAGKAYYQRMMTGANRIVDDLKVDAEATKLSDLHRGNSFATAIGVSNARFKMAVGDAFAIPLRWTAALSRDDGRWRVVTLHFSANVFDNPVSKVVSGMVWLWAGLAGLAGLVLGWLGARAVRR